MMYMTSFLGVKMKLFMSFLHVFPQLFMRNMLESYPEGLVACVSDSFDIWRACKDYWGGKLKDLIKGRGWTKWMVSINFDGFRWSPHAFASRCSRPFMAFRGITDTKFGRLVVRPDSGDPAETCCSILKILLEQFKEDVTTTKTGHKLLPPYIRVIQGDGVDWESIPKILEKLKGEKIAAENIGFGSGGALLQKLNRDTFKCAFKRLGRAVLTVFMPFCMPTESN